MLYSFAGSRTAAISTWGRHAVCIATYASFVCAGAVLDRKRHALALELARCVVAFLAFAFALPLSFTLALLAAHLLAFALLLLPIKAHFAMPVCAKELSSDGPSDGAARKPPRSRSRSPLRARSPSRRSRSKPTQA